MKKRTVKEKRAQDRERKRLSDARLKEAGNTVLKVTINKEATAQFQQIMEHIRETHPKATKGQVVEALIGIGYTGMLDNDIMTETPQRPTNEDIKKALASGPDFPTVS